MKTLTYSSNVCSLTWQFTQPYIEGDDYPDFEVLVYFDFGNFSCVYDLGSYLSWGDYSSLIEFFNWLQGGTLKERVFFHVDEQAPVFEFIPKTIEHSRDFALSPHAHNFDPDECRGGVSMYIPISGLGSALKLNFDAADAIVLVTFFSYVLNQIDESDPGLSKLMAEGVIFDTCDNILESIPQASNVIEGRLP